MPKKYTQEKAAEKYEAVGSKLLGPYMGSQEPSLCKCPDCDNSYYQTITGIRRGHRCEECAKKTASQKISAARTGKILSQEYIEGELEKHGCKLLSEYKGLRIPFEFECQCGHKDKKQWHHFKKDPHCRWCGHRNRKYTFEEAKELFLSKNLTLLANEYIDSRYHMLTKCNVCDHQWNTTLSMVKQNKGCPECAIRNRSGINHPKKRHLLKEEGENNNG